MYDGACLSDPVPLQRAVGELRVGVKRYEDRTVLDDLRQAGCLKARFPRCAVPGWMDVVTLNTGGGVAGGDRLDVTIEAGPGTQAVVAAQASERCYRARDLDAPSRVRTRLTVGRGAALEWLPQETILYDRSALDRRCDIEMTSDARFLAVETLVFGRLAMGEAVRQGWLRDLIRVRRAGELLLHDAVRIDGAVDEFLSRPAIAKGAKALATLVYVAPDAEAKLEAVRTALASGSPLSSWPDPSRPSAREPLANVEAGASAWNGMLIARILGPDSASVRASVVGALAVLREARPLPRVWLC
jgi:urease accessory protein